MNFKKSVAILVLFFMNLSTWAQSDLMKIAKGELIFETSFDQALDKKVSKVKYGSWKIENGVLKGKELKEEKHMAAWELTQVMNNPIIEFKFRLVGDGRNLSFLVNVKKGAHGSRVGHLWWLSAFSENMNFVKSGDKKNPKQDPKKVLMRKAYKTERNKWYAVKVVNLDDKVAISIDGRELSGESEIFKAVKDKFLLRCNGDGLEVDDLKIWEAAK
ncbi:MAG: hypothetical protein NE330_08465 [Lentisphaeraceae bacterium]|nr:hypothetical protein [Lentisphaeraceae bacterium]